MSSEIARIRQQIELESSAMKLAMYGFATVARHEFISHKYDTIGKCQEQLQTLTGEKEATQITVATYTMVMEQEGERSKASRISPGLCLYTNSQRHLCLKKPKRL